MNSESKAVSPEYSTVCSIEAFAFSVTYCPISRSTQKITETAVHAKTIAFGILLSVEETTEVDKMTSNKTIKQSDSNRTVRLRALYICTSKSIFLQYYIIFSA